MWHGCIPIECLLTPSAPPEHALVRAHPLKERYHDACQPLTWHVSTEGVSAAGLKSSKRAATARQQSSRQRSTIDKMVMTKLTCLPAYCVRKGWSVGWKIGGYGLRVAWRNSGDARMAVAATIYDLLAPPPTPGQLVLNISPSTVALERALRPDQSVTHLHLDRRSWCRRSLARATRAGRHHSHGRGARPL